jgi:hypothetical protein
MSVKQKLRQIISLSSSYFVIPFALLIFSSLSTNAVLLHISQHAMAQTPDKESKSNFLTYGNPSYGITIRYPSDWKRVEPVSFKGDHDKSIVEFKSPSAKPLQKNDLATIRISVHNLPSHAMLDQFAIIFDKSGSQKILLRGFILSYFTSLLTKKLPDFNFIKSESDATATLADN